MIRSGMCLAIGCNMKQTKARKSIVTLFNSFILTGIVLGLIAFSVMIGMYNYRTSMQDLTSKVSKYASLAAISLREPIWNYDETAVSSVFTAILLDKDVVAIRVLGATDDKTTSEKKREAVEKTDFAELLKDPHHFNNLAEIAKDGKAIARVQIVASSARVRESIRETTMLIAGFSAGFMAILSVFIWGMGKRVLARPIRTLRDSADRLADGDLDQVIQTGRNDELGALAGSFDKMRNAIRKKLADLATLNSAGEKLAGIHDQVLALETAIDVMSRQTNVARGSIYLLDKDGSLKLSAYSPKYDSEVDHMPKSFSMNEGIVGKVAQSGKICFV
ncbi:MAG: HAMP domain-containing protein, partial [Neisseriaceae bacterium]